MGSVVAAAQRLGLERGSDPREEFVGVVDGSRVRLWEYLEDREFTTRSSFHVEVTVDDPPLGLRISNRAWMRLLPGWHGVRCGARHKSLRIQSRDTRTLIDYLTPERVAAICSIRGVVTPIRGNALLKLTLPGTTQSSDIVRAVNDAAASARALAF